MYIALLWEDQDQVAWKFVSNADSNLRYTWVSLSMKLPTAEITRAEINGWQLAKMKKSIPDMSLPWNL